MASLLTPELRKLVDGIEGWPTFAGGRNEDTIVMPRNRSKVCEKHTFDRPDCLAHSTRAPLVRKLSSFASAVPQRPAGEKILESNLGPGAYSCNMNTITIFHPSKTSPPFSSKVPRSFEPHHR